MVLRWVFVLAGLAIAVVVSHRIFKGGSVLPIAELRVRITGSTEIPEPTKIQSTGDWYFLDHVSSGLALYDGVKKTFVPMLAESWRQEADGRHTFKLRSNAKFHDGTPITTKDVAWSIKRHLIFKTSTHFPLWEYLVGCDDLKILNDECEGLKFTETEITFRLKKQVDSFYLQLASPETGVWCSSDMDPATAKLNPTKFSGPYFVSGRDEDSALLKRNEENLISKEFPQSPRSIRIKRVPLSKMDAALINKEIDLAIKMHTPLGERAWKKDGLGVYSTTPSSIIYLFGLGQKDRSSVGADLLQALWKSNRDPVLSSSGSFLPYSSVYGLSENEFLAALGPKTAKKLRILYPEGFFPAAFLEQIQRSAESIGSEIVFSPLAPKDFMAAFTNEKLEGEYDYILSAYAASERYPAVQLRYLTKSLAKPPIDLKEAESPDFSGDRIQIFHEYEKWLLSSRQAIPLYFDVTLFVHQKNIDIGEQSKSDAEIELWRVTERRP